MSFRVVYSGVWIGRIKILMERARALGLGNELERALTGLDEIMSQSPIDRGEPLYTLKAIKLTVFVAPYRYFTAKYAVDEERSLVYLMRFALGTGHPYPPEFEEILNPKKS